VRDSFSSPSCAHSDELEHDYRGKGFAKEALTLLQDNRSRPTTDSASLTYVVNSPLNISPTQFIVKIGAKNESSIRLFERLGFGQVRLVVVWDEVEMRWGWKPSEEAAKGSKEDWPALRLDGRVGSYAVKIDA